MLYCIIELRETGRVIFDYLFQFFIKRKNAFMGHKYRHSNINLDNTNNEYEENKPLCETINR